MADYTIPQFPMKRLRYFNNQFLTEQDFVDDQAAHLSHERAHLRALCAPGVLEGLAVTLTAGALSIAAGVAVDDQGRLIALSAPAPGPTATGLAAGTYVVHIRYNEVDTDPTTNPGGGASSTTRFTSVPILAATASGTNPPTSAVVLGGFTVTVSGGTSTITAASTVGRQFSGLRLPSPFPTSVATLTWIDRTDGFGDAAQLNGLLTVRRDNGSGVTSLLRLVSGSTYPNSAGAGPTIDLSPYDPGANAPSLRIQSIGDGNGSSHFVVLNKQGGAIGNSLAERFRITNTGAVQIPGSLSVPSITGAVSFAGAVTMSSTLGVTGTLSANAVQLTSAAEVSTSPLEASRDYLGNIRSVVDHNGYRMGQLTELDENWKRGGSINITVSTASVSKLGSTTNVTTDLPGLLEINSSSTAASWAVPTIQPGMTLTAVTAFLFRSNATDNVTVAVFDVGNNGSVQLASASSSSGTQAVTVPLTGSLPFTVASGHVVTMTASGTSVTGFTQVMLIQATAIVDPEGWTWSTTNPNPSGSQRKYLDPNVNINQRAVQLIAQGSVGTFTTEAYECFMNPDVAFVQEWMLRTGTITDASNTRQFACGIQNNNGGSGNRFVYFYNQASMANWQLRVVGSTIADTDTGVAVAAATTYRMRLEILGANVSSAGTGNFRIRAFINGTKVADVASATLPAADVIRPFMQCGVTGGTGGPYDFSVGRVRRVWNHRLTPEAL